MLPNRRSLISIPLLLIGLGAPTLSAQQTHVIQQIQSTFVPNFVTAKVGDSIRWVRTGGTHTVTEGTPPVSGTGAEAFDAPLDAANPEFLLVVDEDFLCGFPQPNNNLYNFYCIPHAPGMKGQFRVQSPWLPLFNALPGTLGAPRLCGFGPLTEGTELSLTLSNALPNALGGVFLGLTQGNAPFYGGTLVPFPLQAAVYFNTGPAGEFGGGTLVSPGLIGAFAYLQAAVDDPGAVEGIALSNAIRARFQ